MIPPQSNHSYITVIRFIKDESKVGVISLILSYYFSYCNNGVFLCIFESYIIKRCVIDIKQQLKEKLCAIKKLI